jgi:hypothetical protein
MPTWQSFAEYAKELKGLESDLTGPEARKIIKEMATEADAIAERSALRDLGGDKAFSGWNRGRPIPLDTRLRPGRDISTILAPTRRSAGPWTVAEFGRNSRAGPRLVGPRLTKTGRVSRARRRRYNGVTQGKKTATRAVNEMDVKLPKIADKRIKAITRKRFDVTR